ncbi:MAG: phosphate propanoyltransferase [Treponema sp.]|jgi:putative phosphotransacetylase|nr:phosphate propanoyltransferase [Treponema sp.]
MDQEKLTMVITQVLHRLEDAPYVVCNVSNRHIHLSQEDLEILFGRGSALKPMRNLLQPGQYACEETVSAIGPKGKRIDKIRVLGPLRGATQLELSLTDTFTLGIPCPVNESGNLDGAGKVKIENPLTGASVERSCGIVALRHSHLCPETAGKFGLKDKQIVSLEFNNGRKRRTVFGDVLLRVSDAFVDEVHLDTDEANAAAVKNGDLALIIP